MKSKVYFSKNITADEIVKMYEKLGMTLPGNVAVKVHSGEAGNQNFLGPDLYKEVINKVNGTVVECNTAYAGKRNTTEEHLQTMKEHGWTENFKVDIMDADGEIELPIPNGVQIKVNYVGKNIKKYDSMLVLSHFKGHPMGGFGGALKNISIGIASSHGKAYIHGAGDVEKIWTADGNAFKEAMADADKSIMDYFKENIAFINVMANMSVDCDCCAVAEDPCMKDIGVLASLDPVALDKACLDLVYTSKDPGRDHLIERIESRNGAHIIEAAEKLGVGSTEYELIEI
mgnify:FL=1